MINAIGEKTIATTVVTAVVAQSTKLSDKKAPPVKRRPIIKQMKILINQNPILSPTVALTAGIVVSPARADRSPINVVLSLIL